MNPSISTKNKNQRLGRAESLNCPDSRAPQLEWEGDCGKKWANEIQLRPGLKVLITNTTFVENSVIHFDIDRAPLFFCFSLSGKSRSVINHGCRPKTVIDARAGVSHISYFPKCRGFSEFCSEMPMRMMHIQLDPTVLHTFLEEEFDLIPSDFRTLIDGELEKHYYRTGFMNPAMQLALHQMQNCPFQGLTKRVFLESKALELIALQLEQSVFTPKDLGGSSTLRPSDVERIHAAMEILVTNMQNPPSLLELAGLVGLNDFKLKIGFRQVCGKTAFGFLHEHRMERSRQLLGDGKMNVKEVSFNVGYTDSGRFSDAFKRQFGVRPSVYRRH